MLPLRSENRRVACAGSCLCAVDALDLTYQEHVGKNANCRNDRHVDEGRTEASCRDQQANHDRCGNRRQVTNEVEHATGQPNQGVTVPAWCDQ